MVWGSWVCLLAPLVGFGAILLAGTRITRAPGGRALDAVGLRRLRGRRRRLRRRAGPRPRRPGGDDDRLDMALGGRLQGGHRAPGRPALAHDDADRHRGRRPHRPLLERLHGRRGRGAAVLRLHGVLRLLDADARDGRQPAAAARRLGPRRPRVVPPDRLLPRPPQRDRRREEGVRDQHASATRRWRSPCSSRSPRSGASTTAPSSPRRRAASCRTPSSRCSRSASSPAPSRSPRRSRSTPGSRTRWRDRRRSPR